MGEDVKPALTPEEWTKSLVEFSSDRIGYAELHHEGEDNEYLLVDGGVVERDRVALAARWLFGTRLGFTWEDVDLLSDENGAPVDVWKNLEARIAALLPPRETP